MRTIISLIMSGQLENTDHAAGTKNDVCPKIYLQEVGFRNYKNSRSEKQLLNNLRDRLFPFSFTATGMYKNVVLS